MSERAVSTSNLLLYCQWFNPIFVSQNWLFYLNKFKKIREFEL